MGTERSRVRRAAVAAALSFGFVVGAGSASAQVPDAETPWEQGREAYADENYDEAARYIIEAIQRDPMNSQYYLGLARTDYWRGNFDRAVYYYDIYLNELASHIASNVRSADRLDNVRSERNSANTERADSGAPVVAPPGLAAAREAFESRLTEGPILTTTGGGALAMYRGMLRAGYAHPDLMGIRTRLSSALLTEASSVLGDHDTALPALSLTQWQTQRERLSTWVSLNPPPVTDPTGTSGIPSSAMDPSVRATLDPRTRVQAHITMSDAQVQYLNQNFAQAASGFRDAIALVPGFIPAHMGRLNSLHRLGNAAHTVETDIVALERALAAHAPTHPGVAVVYRAAFAAQRGDSQRTAMLLGDLLGVPPSAAP